MKQQIHKFDLDLYAQGPSTTIEVPSNAEILRCHNQRNRLIVWIRGEWDSALDEKIRLVFVGTGQKEIDPNWIYVDTVLFNDGGLVIHVFQVP